MNNQMLKKEEEYNFLQLFRSVYPDFPKGKIVASESPDFIIRPNKKTAIGIELTKWIVGNNHSLHPLSENEEQQYRLINRIKELFSIGHEANYWSAQFVFSPKKIHSDQLETLAQKILKTLLNEVEKHSTNNNKALQVINRHLPEAINTIRLTKHPEDSLSYWGICPKAILKNDFIENIGSCIRKKEDKLRLYQKKVYNAYWLIIIADCIDCSTSFNMHNLIEKAPFNSNFDQVFLFDFFAKKVINLH